MHYSAENYDRKARSGDTRAVRWGRAAIYVTFAALLTSRADAQEPPSGAGSGSGSGSAAGDEPEPPPATTGVVSGTVESPDLEAPLAGATVTVVGTTIRAVSDDAGHFSLTLPPGSVKLRAESSGFTAEERTVRVEAGATRELLFKLPTAPLINETVVVVGSRTPRTNLDTPVPVDVITKEEIARSGRTELGRILDELVPSFLSTPQTISDGTDHVDPSSLRGLGPDQVLILVNGKRLHHSALLNVNSTFGRGTVSTDLAQIPVASIERIEVLRDGAAALYGSDAIAGVINIVTKDATDVLDVSSLAGVTASKDGAQLTASVNDGFKLGNGGFLNITGEFRDKQATNRAGTYTGPIYSPDGSTDASQLAALGLTRDDFRMRVGEAAATTGIGEYNMALPFADGTATFYSFGNVSYRRGDAAGFYRYPYETTENVGVYYPNGFLPLIQPLIEDNTITIGVRRKGTWQVDASLTHGTSSFQFDIGNSVNASLGTASPTTFDAGKLEYSETVANLDLLRKLDTGFTHATSLVLGSELRVENYQIQAGDEASYEQGPVTVGNPPTPAIPGSQVFPGFQPSNQVDRTRDNVGIYAGLENEITKAFALDFESRFESYSDFGDALIGKVAARYKVAPWLSLRAGANTGFRAPSLQQTWFSNVSTLFLPDSTGVLQPTEVLTSNNASPVTQAFDIPKLKAERSDNASGGFALRPLENLSFTVDGYFIRIYDRIVLTSQFANTDPVVADILAPFPSVSEAQFFANAVDTDTYGVDAVADYAVDLHGGSSLRFTAAANFTTTQVIAVHIPGSLESRFGGESSTLSDFVFGRAAQNQIENIVPHQKGTASIHYSTKRLSALVRANYYGKVYYRPDDPADDETFGAKVLFNVNLGYHITKDVVASIGADNLLNTFPDKQTKPDNIDDGVFVYSRYVSQFGMNGGFYYVRLQLLGF
jgi:iron complex outermembrane recepter protein